MCDYAQQSAVDKRTLNFARAADQQAGLKSVGEYRRPTLAEELAKQQAYAADESSKRSRAIDFLRDNPAFGEFVTLVREGCINF